MGTIITSGVGSGLDIAGLVTKLVQAEGQATRFRIDSKEASAQGKLSALASLRSALANLQSAASDLKEIDDFRGRAVALSSEAFISASANSAASPGSYSIEVERLATAQRLVSQAFVTEDTVVGTGTLTLSLGAAAFTVDIDSSNNTLAGIAAAINAKSENTGIQATLLKGVDGTRLILNAEETGALNTITVTEADGDGGLASLVYDPGTLTNLTETQAAQDSRVLINSFAVESTTNSISDAITGLDLALLATNAVGETTELSIAFDQNGARTLLTKLVDSYNKLLTEVGTLASFDPESRISGPLFGDAGLRNIAFQLRREFSGSVTGLTGPFQILSQIGVETQLDGKLTINAETLDAAFAENFDAVGELIADGDNGLAVRLDAILESYLKTDGVMESRTDSVNAEIRDLTEQRERLAVRLTAVEARLRRQFNALDGLLAQLQNTSSFLTQQLSSLPGSNALLRRN